MLIASPNPIASLLLGANPLNSLSDLPNLEASYDAYDPNSVTRDSVGRVSQWTDQTGRGRNLAQGTAASQPIYLPWSGQNYGYCPGAAGNSFSTPDSAAVSVTGDLDLRVNIAALDWTPSAYQALITKYNGAGQKSYALGINGATGIIIFGRSIDGSADINYFSTVAPAVADGASLWIRITLDVDNGSAQSEVRFYTSSDGATWAELGAAVTNASTAATFDSTAAVLVGELGIASLPLSGRAFYAEIRNGINGTVVAAFDPSRAADGATSFVAATGETWTVNSSGGKPAQIVGRSSVLFDGSDDCLKTAGFTLNQPETVYWVGKVVTWANGTRLFGGGTNNSELFCNSASPQLAINAGASVVGLTTLPVATPGVVTVVFNGASSFYAANRAAGISGNAGANNTGGFTLATNWSPSGGTYGNVQVSAVAIFASAHDARTQARVIDYLIRKYGINA